jgi:hypothetical protein
MEDDGGATDTLRPVAACVLEERLASTIDELDALREKSARKREKWRQQLWEKHRQVIQLLKEREEAKEAKEQGDRAIASSMKELQLHMAATTASQERSEKAEERMSRVVADLKEASRLQLDAMRAKYEERVDLLQRLRQKDDEQRAETSAMLLSLTASHEAMRDQCKRLEGEVVQVKGAAAAAAAADEVVVAGADCAPSVGVDALVAKAEAVVSSADSADVVLAEFKTVCAHAKVAACKIDEACCELDKMCELLMVKCMLCQDTIDTRKMATFGLSCRHNDIVVGGEVVVDEPGCSCVGAHVCSVTMRIDLKLQGETTMSKVRVCEGCVPSWLHHCASDRRCGACQRIGKCTLIRIGALE